MEKQIDLQTEILTVFILIFTILSLAKLLLDKIFVKFIIRQISRMVEKYKKINGFEYNVYHKNSNNPNEDYQILIDQNLLLFGVADHMNNFYSEWKNDLDHEKIKGVLEVLRIDKLISIWWTQRKLLKKMKKIEKYLLHNLFQNDKLKLYYENDQLNLGIKYDNENNDKKYLDNFFLSYYKTLKKSDSSRDIFKNYLIPDPKWILQICKVPYVSNELKRENTNESKEVRKQKRKWKKEWLKNWDIRLIDLDYNCNLSLNLNFGYNLKKNKDKQKVWPEFWNIKYNKEFALKSWELIIDGADSDLNNKLDFDLFISNLSKFDRFHKVFLKTKGFSENLDKNQGIFISYFIDVLSIIDNQLDRIFYIDIFKTLFRYYLKIRNFYLISKNILIPNLESNKTKKLYKFIEISSFKKDSQIINYLNENSNINDNFIRWLKNIDIENKEWYNGFKFLTINDPIWDYSDFFSNVKDVKNEQ